MRRRAGRPKKSFRICWKEPENVPELIQSLDPISGLISQGIIKGVIFPMLSPKEALCVLLSSRGILKALGGKPAILALGARILERRRDEIGPLTRAIIVKEHRYGRSYRRDEYTQEQFENVKKFWDGFPEVKLFYL